jgi:hypothetical protein
MMILLCLLCACAGKANDPLQAPMDFRADLLARGGCAFELEALADTDGQTWALTLACELDAEGGGTVRVLAPESIAGITAVTDGGTGSLVYEDLALGLGTLPDTELAPAAAPGRLVRAWARDWIASAGTGDGTLLACYEDGSLTVRTWFDAEGVPVRAELSIDGYTRFQTEIRNFTWKPSP